MAEQRTEGTHGFRPPTVVARGRDAEEAAP